MKHDSKMTSGLLETLKEKNEFGGKLFNDLWMSKMSYEEGLYTFEAKHLKNIILSTLAMCFVLESRKILTKHCTIPHTSWRRDHESFKYFRSIYDTFKCFGYKVQYHLPCFG